MKALQGPIFRAIVAIVVGALLIKFRNDTLHWLTVAVGALFFASGVVSCLGYLLERRRVQQAMQADACADTDAPRPRMPFFPIVGVGSGILGAILMCMPDSFIESVAIVLSVILALGALGQLITLGQARRYAAFPLIFWLFPLITLTVAVIILVNPKDAMTMPLLVIGWCMIFYGVVEAVNALKVHQLRRAFERAEEQRIAAATQSADSEEAEILEEGESTKA